MSRTSPEEPEYAHFAMLYIDSNGNLCQRASDSISESLRSILSPSVTGRFLQAVAMSKETHTTRCQGNFPLGILVPSNRQKLNNSSAPSQEQSAIYSGMELGSPQRTQVLFLSQPEPPFQPAMWPSREPWPLQAGSQSKKNFGGRTLNLASHQRVLISIKDRCLLRRYYEKIFQTLQQTNCRIIAKAYIKLIEVRKQVNYPYNGRKVIEGRTQQLDPEETKPPWWPRGVSHREPDHLPKIERIRLLVHMLCDMRETHGVTAARLKQCDPSIRRQILPVERLETLDEAYRVREEEERFLDGISGTYLSTSSSTPSETHMYNLDGEYLSIACTNLPQMAEDTPSGQGSPTEPVSSQNIVETECSEGISHIDITQVTPTDLLSAPAYNTSNPYNLAMHFDPKTHYHSAGLWTNIPTSPLQLSEKQKWLYAPAHSIGWAPPVGMAHYPYPGMSDIAPTSEFHGTPNLPRGARVRTHTWTENELTEAMMPYGHPYYFNY
ncbi:hypothetical protein N7537_010470 [Penicillium hordei]|uniref:Subtelomeric hrmA-associated cluster protein AFUB-079030/YDR124W-like helical bundle domain-containing protein n=1 Tax=Penicillium hordei TaxID=40994 RepID=A0AAD6GVP4_9EURO|nr:uncharacterized protein N7537_010470 [Penicillium hordei]KAJ5593566.1 hypothetical protein N7537_010470 [Penicillium hordei]